MAFNEDSRVKIPAILHLQKLGYKYLSIKSQKIDESTNIFTDIFTESMKAINGPDISQSDIDKLLTDISLELDNDDLGKVFYERLLSQSGMKILDLENFDKNSFHVVTELTCRNGDDEFRPDITVIINGLPLAFIEVKKPNNHEGILAERDRINIRFKNDRFKKFINITQLLIFSNNMEYDNSGINPLPGAFYATTALGRDVKFNNFREEEVLNLSSLLKSVDPKDVEFVLKDNNQMVIRHSPEFLTNTNPDTPTNRILTSLLQRDRIKMIIRFAIAYVEEPSGLQKHIMRYPQFFATKAIENKLTAGENRGIIWHTQGSGKTALAYYNVRYLTHYFQKKGIIPKFYFIVDRLDLLNQASAEFSNRGLVVRNVNSREEFASEFKQGKAVHGLSGKPEITVVNIQKFKDDTRVLEKSDYDVSVQRVYFLDEAHRSYDPTGSFLANLYESDRSSIKIALTGTPLIVQNPKKELGKEDKKTTRNIFGEYIHKYYYNSSIADGYTLRLIREGIESNYKIELESILKEIEVQHKEFDKKEVYAHRKFVEPMLDYIVKDFRNSRVRFGDNSIGGLVVCSSSEQARVMKEVFDERHSSDEKQFKKLTAELILHDEGSKDERREKINLFKTSNKIDILFVYNMLLTGFDAHRLKKLYLGRVVKSHNLLQTLTRVNRPYKDFQYGFVVDFADISKEFDATNRAYFDELNKEYGDNLDGETENDVFGSLFKSAAEIEREIEDIKENLFSYDLENAEKFSQQINQIDDRKKMIEIKNNLENARNLYNLVKLLGHYDLVKKIDFSKLSILFNEASRRLDLLNLKESMQTGTEGRNILNAALENVLFTFTKISEEELKLADEMKDIVRKTREALGSNFDPSDPFYVSLYEEFKRLFELCNMSELTQDELHKNMKQFNSLYDRIKELNRNNDNLRAKYGGDKKYTRTHKRLKERKLLSNKDSEIFQILMNAKDRIDGSVHDSESIVDNRAYFTNLVMQKTINSFDDAKVDITYEAADTIKRQLTKEYIDEYNGIEE